MRVGKLTDTLSRSPADANVFIIVGGTRRRFTVIKVPEGLYLVPHLHEDVPLPPDLVPQVENRSEQSKNT